MTDFPTVTTDCLDIAASNFGKLFNQDRPVTMKAHQVGKLNGKLINNHDFPSAGFIESNNLDAVAERRTRASCHRCDVLNADVGSYVIVCDMDVYVGYARVISNCAVGDSCIVDAAGLFNTFGELYIVCEPADADTTKKLSVSDTSRIETIGNFEQIPVFGGAALVLKNLPFGLLKISVRLLLGHNNLIFIWPARLGSAKPRQAHLTSGGQAAPALNLPVARLSSPKSFDGSVRRCHWR